MKQEFFKKLKLPDKPGVYFFLKTSPKPSPGRRGRPFPLQGKAGDEVLYIGKATSLRDRVKSYFGKDLIETRGPLLVDMIFQADKIDWQITDSVLEAIILEANLIKKHQPKYNTKEKSDKSFNFVCITKPARNASHSDAGGEKLPKVLVVRGKNVKHSVFDKIYGPFPNGSQLKEALKIIRRIFPFLDDKSKNHYKFYKQVYLVPDISNEKGIKQYKKNIQNLKLFFEGKKRKILKNLQKEMKEYAKMHEFEKAGEIKRQIFALQHINDVALMKYPYPASPYIGGGAKGGGGRIEAYDIAHMGGKNMVGVMVVLEDGEMAKNEYKKFRIRTQDNANDTGALSEVLERRLAHKEWTYPNLIVVDGGVAQINATKKIILRTTLDISVVSVVKDEKHKPKAILGDDPRHGGASKIITKYKKEILLANSEAHRFAIAYHKNLRARNFLKK
jgi:excinuclease ABC subunit C